MRHAGVISLLLLFATVISCGGDGPAASPAASSPVPSQTPGPPEVELSGLILEVEDYGADLIATVSGSFSLSAEGGPPVRARITLPGSLRFAGDPQPQPIDIEPGEGPVEVSFTGQLPVGASEMRIELLPGGGSSEAPGALRYELEVPPPVLVSEAVWEYAKETQGTESNDITWFRKWEKTGLRVFVGGTDESVAFFWQAAERLSELTGLTFTEYPLPLQSDLIVLVGLTKETLIPLLPADRQAEAQAHFETNVGAFDWELEDDAVIMQGYAMALGEPNSQEFTNHNILEEVTQVLGPGADSPRYENSIFYEVDGVSGRVTELSEMDESVLRFLYDDRIAAGDTFEEVEKRIVFTDDLDSQTLEKLIADGEPVYRAEPPIVN